MQDRCRPIGELVFKACDLAEEILKLEEEEVLRLEKATTKSASPLEPDIDSDERNFANFIKSTYAQIKSVCPDFEIDTRIGESGSDIESVYSRYVHEIGPLQFGAVDFACRDCSFIHSYADSIKDEMFR